MGACSLLSILDHIPLPSKAHGSLTQSLPKVYGIVKNRKTSMLLNKQILSALGKEEEAGMGIWHLNQNAKFQGKGIVNEGNRLLSPDSVPAPE